jgi:5-methylcytosine-specific restriction protein B
MLRETGYDVPDPVWMTPRVPPLPPDVKKHPAYTLEEAAAETHLDLATLTAWAKAINRKGQAILYGPPGTGKTYVAERLRQYLLSGGDGHTDLVQFHPAYAYEDFIQGLRPQAMPDGRLTYGLIPGRFMEFCAKAARRSGLSVLIIDEINRANLSQVFGELMYLLEYRDRDLPLAGGGRLRIPPNVRIIGTMNTADRSIALVDHALRRRFAFLPLAPNLEVLRRFHEGSDYDVSGLASVLEELNGRIADPHYAVGISFFLRASLPDDLEAIWLGEIEPYVEELFFDRKAEVDRFRWREVRARIQPQPTA